MKSKRQKRRWNKAKRKERRKDRYFHLVLPHNLRDEFLDRRQMLQLAGTYTPEMGRSLVASMLEQWHRTGAVKDAVALPAQ